MAAATRTAAIREDAPAYSGLGEGVGGGRRHRPLCIEARIGLPQDAQLLPHGLELCMQGLPFRSRIGDDATAAIDAFLCIEELATDTVAVAGSRAGALLQASRNAVRLLQVSPEVVAEETKAGESADTSRTTGRKNPPPTHSVLPRGSHGTATRGTRTPSNSSSRTSRVH